jgi:GGDEF domain-containing protein
LRPDRTFYAFRDAAPVLERTRGFDAVSLSELVSSRSGDWAQGSTQEQPGAKAHQRPEHAWILLPSRLRAQVRPPTAEATPERVDAGWAASQLLWWVQTAPVGQHLASSAHAVPFQVPDVRRPRVRARVLDAMADSLIALGGSNERTREPWWEFAVILQHQDLLLPVQQRHLVIQAQSARSPHLMHDTVLGPTGTLSLSFRAVQSGRIVTRREIAKQDPAIAYQERERARSALALPIEGHRAETLGVLYLGSRHADAFDRVDQVVLRIMGRMLGELLANEHARSAATTPLSSLIARPDVVDAFFAAFASENDFLDDLYAFLTPWVQAHAGHAPLPVPARRTRGTRTARAVAALPTLYPVLSLVAVDADDLSRVADRYGEVAARNLMQEIGGRIESWITTQRSQPHKIRLYRIYGDRFYLWLNDLDADKVRIYAERLQYTLSQRYRISATRVAADQLVSSADAIDPGPITVRVAVNTYTHVDLAKLVQGDPSRANLAAKIMGQLDEALKRGQQHGGNKVVVWDAAIRGIMVHEPTRTGFSDAVPPESTSPRIDGSVARDSE